MNGDGNHHTIYLAPTAQPAVASSPIPNIIESIVNNNNNSSKQQQQPTCIPMVVIDTVENNNNSTTTTTTSASVKMSMQQSISRTSTPPLCVSNVMNASTTRTDIVLPLVYWAGAPTHIVTSILITPDKSTVITGSQNGHIVISSVSIEQQLQQQQQQLQLQQQQFTPRIFTLGHNGVAVTCLAMCEVEDHEAVVSTGADGSLCVWNISDGYCLIASVPAFLPCSPSCMVSLPHNKRMVAIVGNGANSIYLVDVQSLKIVATLNDHIDWITSLYSCTTSEDATPLLLSGSLDGTIRFWSLNEGEYDYSLQSIILTPGGEGNCDPNEAPLCFELSPDGKSLLVISKAHWSIFSTCNTHKLMSIKCPSSHGWFGGKFIDDSTLVLAWTRDGRSFLYRLDQSYACLKTFSMGYPMPLDGTSPIIIQTQTDNILASSYTFDKDMELSHLSSEAAPPTLLMCFDKQQEYSSDNITNKIGAAMCWANIFLTADVFGQVRIWVIPLDSKATGRTPICPPTLVGNIADGWRVSDINEPTVTASLVIEDMMLLIRGYDDGSISTSKLPMDNQTKFYPGSHIGRVNCLMCSPSSTKRHLFTASNDTTIKVWDLSTFRLLHTFSHHTGPVTSIFILPQPKKNTLISVSEDKSIGMYSMDDLQCKHIYGVHSLTITGVYWRPEQGYFIVETIDGSVSVWVIASGELEGRAKGKMARDIIENAIPLSSSTTHLDDHFFDDFTEPTQSFAFTQKDEPPIQTIFLNINVISEEIIKYTDMHVKYNSSFSAVDASPSTATTSPISFVQEELNQLVSMFSYLIPWGVSAKLDAVYANDVHLAPPEPRFSFGLLGEGGNLSFLTPKAARMHAALQCSDFLTSQITLAAVAMSRTILRVGGMETICGQLLTSYCVDIPDSLTSYIYPDLSYLASFCLNSTDDIMFSARTIFKVSVERMPIEQLHGLIDYYTILSNCGSLGIYERDRIIIVLAKIISHRKEDLHPKIGQELLALVFGNKDHPVYSAAVELIGKGFKLWRDGIRDQVPHLIKCLFTLSMQNDLLSNIATNSILLIGSHDTIRFIQTIGDEIAHHEAQAISSTVQAIILIGLLIKNNANSVLPFLPNVLDCILKSLDQHMPAIREACLRHTTSVLHLMVQRYPMMSYHNESQRLLLGTMDGAIVMYDLKSATICNRLDGHERAHITALSFNDNGKEFASFSSKDCTLKIFQTNSSFFGLLGSQLICTKTVKIPMDEVASRSSSSSLSASLPSSSSSSSSNTPNTSAASSTLSLSSSLSSTTSASSRRLRVENTRVQWVTPMQLLLKTDSNSFTLDITSNGVSCSIVH
ncbi:hypothetical protein SAMD00019534_094300 [Acytostelium subglobosum LB1]|uniref:hypothetical protein n=1 Tax=Acytostelium subglobosum LB1 TaxID=1410327 RepID=UPI00064517B7|nr:hypothetical protein SAMD00019534_094300 [Acytostelium subglobosum LB1]GAM26255.1 hypothetical protein SAMD00019534_094300 [Acytostelium subglobosum LB1]|eukprot:XP_012750809.1 hypothetical protein SAMD00019534_094300 [Acytostelium subglobosum LB1]